MSNVSPKIIAIDLEKAFPNALDQDNIFSLVEYLDDQELKLLHEVLRTKLVLKVIGHDRRNPDVRHLLTRLTKQWSVLERTIKHKRIKKTDHLIDIKSTAIKTLKNAISEVNPS